MTSAKVFGHLVKVKKDLVMKVLEHWYRRREFRASYHSVMGSILAVESF